uniref:Inhibin subunit beta Aa n=1 Tax=Eptatretus burgeri TaxID=7764 RepID=A0A8C4ND32_EPTBU
MMRRHAAAGACLALLAALVSSSLSADSASRGQRGCDSCGRSRRSRVHDTGVGDSQLTEAVKRHILAQLHLRQRPNITKPLSQGTLAMVLQNLHAGRLRADGRRKGNSRRGSDGRTWRSYGEDAEQSSEIIAFSEPGNKPDGLLSFAMSAESRQQSRVDKAALWIYLMVHPHNARDSGRGTRRRVKLQIFAARENPKRSDELIAERQVMLRRTGWHSIGVKRAVEDALQDGASQVRLRLLCSECGEAGATVVLGRAAGDSKLPILVTRLGETAARRSLKKRGLECDGESNRCCRKTLFIDFKSIEWDDWIIAPKGYFGNYCDGECPGHLTGVLGLGGSSSFYGSVIQNYWLRISNQFNDFTSCCVPTRLSAISMLYYDDDQNVVKKDVPNMIVEECGCF